MEDYESEVRDILSKMKVKKIVPQDLDLELLWNPELMHIFFAVRSVTDNTGTEEILNILNGNISELDIAKQLYNGSISLLSEQNTFEGIDNSHVQRDETIQLLNWTQSKVKKDSNGNIQNICLLAAPAGYGKTIILKDFFLECQTLKIPVLGLKTDKLYSYTNVRKNNCSSFINLFTILYSPNNLWKMVRICSSILSNQSSLSISDQQLK